MRKEEEEEAAEMEVEKVVRPTRSLPYVRLYVRLCLLKALLTSEL